MMEKRRFFQILFSVCVLCLFLSAEGCGYRPAEASPAGEPVLAASPTSTETPVSPPAYTVSFYANGSLLTERSFTSEDIVHAPDVSSEDAVLIGWENEDGKLTDLHSERITAPRSFSAVFRPRLSENAPYLFPFEDGFLHGDDPLTNAQASAMANALLDGADRTFPALSGEEDAPLSPEEFTALLSELFDPRSVEKAVLLSPEAETVSRAEAAQCLMLLLDRSTPETLPYYPDISPKREFGTALLAAAPESGFSKDELAASALDGFLWFDGYLYRLDDEGYFLTDTTEDGLAYDSCGRYTCGNAELDKYVAETIAKYLDTGKTRRENLHALYYHIKNDFMYLTRNYYDSGAVGWDIDEALTLFSTGKGNCYCYAGAFCALARGMGYNAVTYSGTMGNQNQKHAWTEITLDGEIYICDPEIEMNYWYLQMYTDNFMIPRKNAGGWNYQAVGRS